MTLAVAGLLLAPSPLPAALAQQPGAFELVVLRAGPSAATLVRGPCGDVGLVDAGRGAADDVLHQLDRWGHAGPLSWVAVSHPDLHAAAGVVEVVTATGTRRLVDDPVRGVASAAVEQHEQLASTMDRTRVDVGATFGLCDGEDEVVLTVLAAGGDGTTVGGLPVTSVDDRGLVLRLDHRGVGVLFPGDVGVRVEEALVADGATLASDVVVVGHQGSSTSSGQRLVGAAVPEAVVASTGNAFAATHGLPSARVRDRWEGGGATWWQTGAPGSAVPLDGDVVLAVDAAGGWELSGSTGRRQVSAVVARPGLRTISDTCTGSAWFVDVPPGGVFAGTIGCAAARGITRGTGPDGTSFAPALPLTRGQLAGFLVRTAQVADVVLPVDVEDAYGDDDGGIFEADLDALAAAGVYPSGEVIDPTAPASRGFLAEAVNGLLAVADLTPPDGLDWFVDGGPAADALAAAGIARGLPDGSFAPGEGLTRGQLSAFVARTLDVLLDGEPASDVVGTPGRQARTPAVLPRRDGPSGTATTAEGWQVVAGASVAVGDGPLRTYTVELADGLSTEQDPGAFAELVDRTLLDTHRGWTARWDGSLQRIDDPTVADVRVVLARPATVDRSCARAGLRTGGVFSCWDGRRAMLNADRWSGGVSHVPDLALYRRYLVNHEVGHGLGFGHEGCAGPGRVAPVMLQLTKSTFGCLPNAWPVPE